MLKRFWQIDANLSVKSDIKIDLAKQRSHEVPQSNLCLIFEHVWTFLDFVIMLVITL